MPSGGSEQCIAIADLGNHIELFLGEQAHHSCPDEHRVLGHDDPDDRMLRQRRPLDGPCLDRRRDALQCHDRVWSNSRSTRCAPRSSQPTGPPRRTQQQPDLDLTTLLRDDLAGTSAEQAALFNQPITDVGNELPGGFWISSLFLRGPLMLHALRLEIGDDGFRTLLHKWVADHRDANANTEDFISLAEKVSGRDLADLFDRWLNSPTMPDDFGSVPTAL